MEGTHMDRDDTDKDCAKRAPLDGGWSRRRTLGAIGGATIGAAAALGAPAVARARTAAQIDRSVADALGDLFRIRPG
ncbi:MAG: hypothetical protein AAF909_06365, partial [Pseudomonadota bacterium]